jgi:catechol 2,3-dioxygenase-like lactoylglutathione lyase family enzyme
VSAIVSGIQQVGVGVPDIASAWAWYRDHFGIDIPIFREEDTEARLMAAYTAGAVHRRTAVLAINLQGGGGLEMWQFTSRPTRPPPVPVQLGDYGIFATRIKSRDVEATYHRLAGAGVPRLSRLARDPAGNLHFFVEDPHGLIFQIAPGEAWFTTGPHLTGGVSGCMIGVSDIDRARRLYSDVLGYEAVRYDVDGVWADLAELPGGHARVRRVLLAQRAPREGPFCRLLGPSTLELIAAAGRPARMIFADRCWGDLGFMHLAFDVTGMTALAETCAARGFPFAVDSHQSFAMAEATGRFSYVEDPDGTMIEFVETHRLPLLKRLGWYLDLRKREPTAPVPDWMLKTLRWHRVRRERAGGRP